MSSKLKMALSAATLVAGLAATPALAQFAAGGAGGGGAVMHGGGGFGGGGFGGAPIAAPAAPMAAPQFHAAPAIVPQARIPQVAPGGGYAAPRIHNPVRTPMAQGSPWRSGGGVTTLPRQPRAWPGAGGAPPHDTAQSMYHGGRNHHGRGHWRGGVWYPYYLGDTYSAYDYDDEECTLRKVRVHTPYGWRRVWRRVCA